MCRQSDLVQGIIWAVDNGARVINISIELSSYTAPLKEAVDYAWESGAIVIAAAGNEGNSEPVYPAAFDDCLSVTGVSKDLDRAPLANYGDWVDAAAPGFMIYGALPSDSYGYQHGTSFAAAYVSGLAARLFALAVDTNGNGKVNDEVREAILAGCRELPDEGAGRGLIDVSVSLDYLLSHSGD
jgi:thermitase